MTGEGGGMESHGKAGTGPGLGLGGLDVDAGIDITVRSGKPGKSLNGISEADQESFSDDPALGFMSEQLGEVADAKAKRIRIWIAVAFIGWAVAGLFGYQNYKFASMLMNYRFPYVLASNGTVQLVSGWPEGAGTVGIQKYEKWVVEYMVRRFLEARYGASTYHARNIWPTFQAFWLRPMDLQAHNDYSQPALAECLKSDTYWQVVDRSILFDRVDPLKNGEGTLYDATVEYLVYQRKNVTDEVVKVQAYKARMRFTMGTPYGETDKARLALWGRINPLHFTLVDNVDSAPVTISNNAEGFAGMTPRGQAASTWNPTPAPPPVPPPPTGLVGNTDNR